MSEQVVSEPQRPVLRVSPDAGARGRVAVHRPSLWLASAAVASGWAAVYSLATWIREFVVNQTHDDVRLYYVAAEAGLRHGWSSLYDQGALREAATTLPAASQVIDEKTFASTPLLAWIFAPLTVFPESTAYALWAVLSIAALTLAWFIAAPYSGLAKFTLLLLALGLWPVTLTLYFGQPTLLVLALVAVTWWLCTKGRTVEAGVVLALATFLKPQAVVLVPVALLVSGRYRTVAAWAGGIAMLALLTAMTLGTYGLTEWWHVLRVVQRLPVDSMFTLAGPLGSGPLVLVVWGVEGALALAVAWLRRREIEIVIAVGVLGSVATAFYFHNSDYSVLIVAGWLVLRTSPSIWHRLWLLLGILPMQLLLTPLLAGPQLLWDGVWLAILAAEALPGLSSSGRQLEFVSARLRFRKAG